MSVSSLHFAFWQIAAGVEIDGVTHGRNLDLTDHTVQEYLFETWHEWETHRLPLVEFAQGPQPFFLNPKMLGTKSSGRFCDYALTTPPGCFSGPVSRSIRCIKNQVGMVYLSGALRCSQEVGVRWAEAKWRAGPLARRGRWPTSFEGRFSCWKFKNCWKDKLLLLLFLVIASLYGISIFNKSPGVIDCYQESFGIIKLLRFLRVCQFPLKTKDQKPWGARLRMNSRTTGGSVY